MLGPLDAAGRFIVFPSIARSSWSSGDLNAAVDVLALDLPVLFDADADGPAMIAWEQTVGLEHRRRHRATTDPGQSRRGRRRPTPRSSTRGTHPRGIVARFLAEGASGAFFDTDIVAGQPRRNDGRDRRRPLRRRMPASSVSMYLRVPPGTTRIIDAEAIDGLEGAAFATTVESDVPIVVDRASRGGDALRVARARRACARRSTTWYLAEGATGGPVRSLLPAAEPGRRRRPVEVTYLRPAGIAPIVTHLHAAAAQPPAQSTSTTSTPALAGADVVGVDSAPRSRSSSSGRCTSSDADAVPRRPRQRGHPALSPTWFFAEGAPARSSICSCCSPTPADPVTVTVDYLTDGGATRTKAYTVGPRAAAPSGWTTDVRRRTTRCWPTWPCRCESPTSAPIAAERAMWWPGRRRAGTRGTRGRRDRHGDRWAFADGGVGGPRHVRTFILIANTDTVDASVRVTILLGGDGDGRRRARPLRVPAGSRFTFEVRRG